MSIPANPLDWSHATTDIPSAGRSFTHVATEAECAAIASELGLIACKRLEASYKIRPLGKGRFRLEGPLAAEVTQACVVTLQPVDAKLSLPLDLDFCPEIAESPAGDETNEAEVLELPEIAPIENGRMNVGEVAFETLAAGLDPFPRAQGAAFTWADPREGEAAANPFAVLHKLRRPPDGESGV